MIKAAEPKQELCVSINFENAKQIKRSACSSTRIGRGRIYDEKACNYGASTFELKRHNASLATHELSFFILAWLAYLQTILRSVGQN
jgi:hypothetical protein